MNPQQHLDWLTDNIVWFENLTLSQLEMDVPCCPGWNVGDVLNHLSFGVGLAYPFALSSPPDITAREVFADAERPTTPPTGEAALAVFTRHMRDCLEIFSRTDPKHTCWTYADPGIARFWFRRAAIETALHRIDVEETLSDASKPLSTERSTDAINEAVTFALPLASTLVEQPAGRLTVSSPNLESTLELGEGENQALINGSGQQILLALWGRKIPQVTITGDRSVAAEWLSLIERAFAGR